MTIHRPVGPLILVILDGWGYREDATFNAIAAARKPNWDYLWQHYPHTLLAGSGCSVGLPAGQMGNSEVGHLTMGAGRIIHQDLTRIDQAIESGEFFNNPILISALNQVKNSKQSLHIMGLLSPGGVHSHEKHIVALVTLAASLGLSRVYLHVFLDGRDTPPRSAKGSIENLNRYCQELACGQIVSIIGRYYAMDRDKRWERIQPAYDLLTAGKAAYHVDNVSEALALAYARGENDEFVQATSIHLENKLPVTISDGDVVIFANFRSDRAREITQALTESNFQGFKREKWPQLHQFVCLSEYDNQFDLPVVFTPQSLKHILAECISHHQLKQLRMAETEKYAHVTFFFNGGVESPYPGEERILIPSPKISTYDLQPEMSARELTERLIQEMDSKRYDLIICNFANPDMVGHSGNFQATIQAIEVIDECIGKLVRASQAIEGEILITADHGNAEQLFDFTINQPHTAHTSEPVPFLYIGRKAKICRKNGDLSDIAPTILYLMSLPQPDEMTGQRLVELI
ncbi:MAG: phosphoglycerate mutase (2,3-diphosphoglycerate-independent) [Gammaproteobacteria bacterium RIFCSPHIGHO2_12_FULL_37_14]|nr:MAG: phosphoglycerate mutase (2,3-diphosphoglycerate-independent) [Gammaproteobacteria bacterium RIFCSPHIGHO2_12_FULL_37_14]